MIIRIKSIEGVGKFSRAHPGSAQFGKVTLIHGSNSIGKTALADIFRATAGQDSGLLQQRLTRHPGGAATSQLLTVCHKLMGDNSEKTLVFNGVWNGIPLQSNALVFDQYFIDNHVYRGSSPDGETGQSLYDFIVGKASVQLANELEGKREELKSAKKELRKAESELREHSGWTADIPTWVNLTVVESLDELNLNVRTCAEEINQLRKQLEHVDAIKKLALPRSLVLPQSRIPLLVEINQLLELSIDTITPETEIKIDSHLAAHFRTNDGAQKSWLSKGYISYFENSCPFCGQDISKVSDWFGILGSFFNQALRENLAKIRTQIPRITSSLLTALPTPTPFIRLDSDNIEAFVPFLSKDQGFLEFNAQRKILIRNCEKAFDEYVSEYDKIRAKVLSKNEAKLEAPENKINPVDVSDFEAAEKKFLASVQQYQECIGCIEKVLVAFQSSLGADSIRKKVSDLEKKLSDLNKRKLRLSSKDYCESWTTLQTICVQLDGDCRRKESELQYELGRFLATYGSKLEETYNSLGNIGFTVRADTARPGGAHRPRISINPEFHGHSITPDRHRFFLSESDRRGLALALFLSYVELLTDDQAANTILVLDDPFTSFDDNRSRLGLMLLSLIGRRVRQIIILSHHKQFTQNAILQFREKFGGDFSFLIIANESASSTLHRGDEFAFLRSQHQDALEEVENFIGGSEVDNIVFKLRIVLEQEVNQRFYRQLRAGHVLHKDFSSRIDYLREEGILSQINSEKLDDFRISCNPDHHIYRESDPSSIRAFANQMLNFIFLNLRPESVRT